MALDFHVFDVEDFEVLIGHPLEKLFRDPQQTGELDVKIGRDAFAIPILQAKNAIAEPIPSCVPEEVMTVLPFESPEESLEKDSEFFIEEVDEVGDFVELPTE